MIKKMKVWAFYLGVGMIPLTLIFGSLYLKAQSIKDLRMQGEPVVESFFTENLNAPYNIAGDTIFNDLKECIGRRIKSQQFSLELSAAEKRLEVISCGKHMVESHVRGGRIADARLAEEYFTLNGISLFNTDLNVVSK